MLKFKFSNPNIHLDACSCRNKSDSSSTTLKLNRARKISPRKYSTVNNEFRAPFEHFATRNNLSKADWYQLSPTKLDESLQTIISKEFKGSMYQALSTIFPETEWYPWKFQHYRAPKGYWKEHSNQRKFFDDLGKKLGIQTLDDWYQKLSQNEMRNGSSILQAYNNSPMNALMAAYPEHNWVPWKFNHVNRGYWNSVANQQKFFDDLGHKLGIQKMDDWYQKLSEVHVIQHGGGGLIAKHKYSPINALMAAYPEHNWIPWKFSTVPRSFWTDQKNQRKFFDALGKQIGIQTLDDWYQKLSQNVMKEKGGASLLVVHQGSPAKALMTAYPEHNWIPWKFNVAPTRFWNSKDNVKQYLSEVSEKLSIQTLDDWYRVDWIQLKHFGAGRLLMKYNGLYNLLKEQYPNHPWDSKRFQYGGKKGQRWLAITLKKMFPNEEILEDYHHPKAVFPSSNRPMQLDVFIQSKSLAFEYQGKQHYEEVGMFSPTKTYQQRDEEKRNLCAANNIKLIEVPYWWNRTKESLQEIMDGHSS